MIFLKFLSCTLGWLNGYTVLEMVDNNSSADAISKPCMLYIKRNNGLLKTEFSMTPDYIAEGYGYLGHL